MVIFLLFELDDGQLSQKLIEFLAGKIIFQGLK